MRDAIVTVGLLLGVLSAWADASQAHAGFIVGMQSLDRPVAPSMSEVPSQEYDYWSEPDSSSIVFWETGRNSPSARRNSLRDFLSMLLSASHHTQSTAETTGSSANSFDSPADGFLSLPDVPFPHTVGRVLFVCILPPSSPFLRGLFRPPRVVR